jgi:hypothetical protein
MFEARENRFPSDRAKHPPSPDSLAIILSSYSAVSILIGLQYSINTLVVVVLCVERGRTMFCKQDDVCDGYRSSPAYTYVSTLTTVDVCRFLIVSETRRYIIMIFSQNEKLQQKTQRTTKFTSFIL